MWMDRPLENKRRRSKRWVSGRWSVPTESSPSMERLGASSNILSVYVPDKTRRVCCRRMWV